ncbi:MAG: response regulator [Tannerellaceae bacterium]|nr:response regulator [Tannerellaceae bacterium]
MDAFFINSIEVQIADRMREGKKGPYLRMTHESETFSFTFVPLDYLDGNTCELIYKLVNQNEKWISLGSSRTIVFSKLQPGDYVLQVKCSSADGEWNGEVFTLPIQVLPPWWLSGYAYMGYLLILVTIIALIQLFLRNRIRMKHTLEISQLESRKLEEIHQAKLRFFTNIAHEFSNSLMLIYGPCERLLHSLNKEDNSTRNYLYTIKSNAERMHTLIQQLMEFRKVETGYLSPKPELVDIPELVKYTVDNFMDVAEQKKIDFSWTVAAELSTFRTDRDCLEKILFNLLSNAFKYTPEEGQVRVKVGLADRKLAFSVWNTGEGIKQEDQQQIFNRFTVLERLEDRIQQGKETRNGIGLALCLGLTDLLGGTIHLTSEPEQYTCFEVILPSLEVTGVSREPTVRLNPVVRPSGHQPQPAHRQERDKTSGEQESRKPVILVIDDDEDIRHLITDILQEQYHVAEAENGEKAFEVADHHIPDLIICDLIMPGLNGIEVLKQFKSQELTQHIPVIFLTSEGSVESQIEGVEAGADAYLIKPFHERHLQAAIERLLTKKQEMKEYYNSPVSAIEKVEGRLVQKSDKEFIVKLIKIISEYMDNDILSPDLLAKEAGVSKMQLYRKLKEIEQQTPTEFIRNMRLKHAEKLLKTTDQTVQEIMYNSGFNNKAYFYREFAKRYQQTPRDYRQHFRQNRE